MQEKKGITVGDPVSQRTGQLQINFLFSKALGSHITSPNGFKVKGTTIEVNEAALGSRTGTGPRMESN